MKKTKKSTWFRIIFLVVIILIIIYTFRGSAGDILKEIKTTTPRILISICGASVVYHIFEAWITYSLARRYNPEFRFRNAMYCAFFCSFYRLSTLGSGQGVAAVLYLGKKGVGYSEATGLYMIQYMMHRVSIAIFSGVFFIANWSVMVGNYKNYAVYLIFAYALTALIATGLIVFSVSKNSHRLILYLVGKLNKNHRLDSVMEKLKESCDIIEKSTKELVTDFKTLLAMFLKNMAKFCFWYSIPFLIMYGSNQVTFLDSLSTTSLSVMTAAVIPTPAGIGSTELVMTGLYSVLVGVEKAAAVTLLYRIATFIFPFVVGGAIIIISKIASRFSKSYDE